MKRFIMWWDDKNILKRHTQGARHDTLVPFFLNYFPRRRFLRTYKKKNFHHFGTADSRSFFCGSRWFTIFRFPHEFDDGSHIHKIAFLAFSTPFFLLSVSSSFFRIPINYLIHTHLIVSHFPHTGSEKHKNEILFFLCWKNPHLFPRFSTAIRTKKKR